MATTVHAAVVVIDDWQFADTAGTLLSSATNSAGTTSWALPASGTNPVTNGSGQLQFGAVNSSAGGLQYADIANLTTGTYQLDVVGITFNNGALTGGTDDFVAFGLVDDTGSTNGRSFSVAGSNSRDKVFFVLGNENNSSGVDMRVVSHGVEQTLSRDLTTGFGGTYDVRVILNATDKSGSVLLQVSGGGYTQVGPQFTYTDTDPAALLLLNYSLNNFNNIGNDFARVDRVTLSAVPEPASLGLLALGSIACLRRRR